MAKGKIKDKAEPASTDLVPLNDEPAYLADPDIMNTGIKDNFDASDVSVPQIKLLQGTSKEVINREKGAQGGYFWHTGWSKVIEDLKFVACHRRKRYVLLAPMDDGQGVLARADDAKTWDRKGDWEVNLGKNQGNKKVRWPINNTSVVSSGLHLFGTSDPDNPNSPPAATLFYEYLVIQPDAPDDGPAILSFSRTALKVARKDLNSKIDLFRATGRPMQALVFAATPRGVDADGERYFTMDVRNVGFASKEVKDAAVNMGRALQNVYQPDSYDDAAASGGAHKGVSKRETIKDDQDKF